METVSDIHWLAITYVAIGQSEIIFASKLLEDPLFMFYFKDGVTVIELIFW